MKALAILALGGLLSFYSCKTQSQATNTTKTEITNNEEGVYNIIVSFTSKGEGINRDIRQKLDDSIASFNKKNNITVDVEKYGWGREGEVDYLFTFKNLSTKQQKSLKAKVKAVIGNTELIFISYNTKCVHKR
jgi:ABC-type glycerol-3-phosphate transport system substrate-binding protein